MDQGRFVYLDNAATTPLCQQALEAMAPYLGVGASGAFGNANSLHSAGRRAFGDLERYRMQVSRALKAGRPDEIVFTSGATEADNAALVGICVGIRAQRNQAGDHRQGRVVVSSIEHDAVLHSARMLRELGFAVDYVEPDRQGHVSPDLLAQVMTDATYLVSVMAANNEVGSVNNVAALARVAHSAGALFHTDAVQALGKIPVDLKAWGVDAASFSAHKVEGPKGVGVLHLKTGTPFVSYLAGGGQERGRRSGTQNVCGIAGCSAAVVHAVEDQQRFARASQAQRDLLYRRLTEIPRVSATVDVNSGEFLPNIVNVCVSGMESQTLILQLDLLGFCVSGGSACSSNSLDPSHVLTALGIERKRAQGSLRISLGPDTTDQDVEDFLAAFVQVVA